MINCVRDPCAGEEAFSTKSNGEVVSKCRGTAVKSNAFSSCILDRCTGRLQLRCVNSLSSVSDPFVTRISSKRREILRRCWIPDADAPQNAKPAPIGCRPYKVPECLTTSDIDLRFTTQTRLSGGQNDSSGQCQGGGRTGRSWYGPSGIDNFKTDRSASATAPASREAMRDARLPLQYRDSCANLLIPLNKCRHENSWMPWRCEVSGSRLGAALN